MRSFKCSDIGMDCAFAARALTMNRLMKRIQDHASDVHKISSMPADLMARIESAVK